MAQTGSSRASLGHVFSQSFESGTKDYQDEVETHDSKLKAIWDNEMVLKKNTVVHYKKAHVLLLSWHKDLDDLKTEQEVADLENLFKEKFMYETTRKTMKSDSRRSAQVQVNRYLAEFVDDHDDTNTLLIIYYAGHGIPGNDRGDLKLIGSTLYRSDGDSEIHEIVWSSAEHNIKKTRADVLVIFDCCHAGELERSVRAPRRAFEFLAATSANSTTRKPGPQSFTSALIWSLSTLLDEQGSFSSHELLRTIRNDAPDFPEDQCPRLSERQRPSSQRKIMFATLTGETAEKENESSDTNEEGEFSDDVRQDFLVRFVFDGNITEQIVKETASHMQRLISENEIKAKAVSWEGINMMTTLQYKDAMVVYPYIRPFSNILCRIRRRSEMSPTEEGAPEQAAPRLVVDEAVQVLVPSSPSSADDISVTTPGSGRTAEPGIGEDQGASPGKALSLDTSDCSVSPLSSFNKPEKDALTPGNRRLKRGREIDREDYDPPAKRGHPGEE